MENAANSWCDSWIRRLAFCVCSARSSLRTVRAAAEEWAPCDGPPTAGHSGAVFPCGYWSLGVGSSRLGGFTSGSSSHHFRTAVSSQKTRKKKTPPAQLFRRLISTCAGLMITSMRAFVAAVANWFNRITERLWAVFSRWMVDVESSLVTDWAIIKKSYHVWAFCSFIRPIYFSWSHFLWICGALCDIQRPLALIC